MLNRSRHNWEVPLTVGPIGELITIYINLGGGNEFRGVRLIIILVSLSNTFF